MYLFSMASEFHAYPRICASIWSIRVCKSLSDFLQSCNDGFDCCLPIDIFCSQHTDVSLQLIDNRYADLLTYEQFHGSIILLHKAYLLVSSEGLYNV